MRRVSVRGRRPGAINPARVHLQRRMRRFATNTRPGMLVLDAGAGSGPYRELFAHTRYEAADFAQLAHALTPLDYVCDLTAIPVEDARFDRVLLNQVLEHLPEPDRALAELFRVLKPGGRIFCSAPLFYAEHNVPYDFYRYTRFGLSRLFEQAGFEIARVEWLEGYFGTIAYQFHVMRRALPSSLAAVRKLEPGWRVVYLAPLLLGTRRAAGALESAFARADLRWRYVGRGVAKNYVVIGTKPTG